VINLFSQLLIINERNTFLLAVRRWMLKNRSGSPGSANNRYVKHIYNVIRVLFVIITEKNGLKINKCDKLCNIANNSDILSINVSYFYKSNRE